MNLTSGTRLGPYEILAPIGAGGMGEVYRARDPRLERDVAIKILPREFSGDARLRLRFEREAKVISALNHPHICAVYDVGQSSENDPISYIVMEYVDGETLAQRLVKGPLPVDDAVRSAIEIADALDKAHREGIVHRDLKPSNIMITRSGAKLLDFGLARSGAAGFSPSDGALKRAAAHEETEHKPLTQEGTILGTLQYMAPEQLEGKPADARTDIFAFGVVLYEMLTGKKAFERETRGGVMTAILSGEFPTISASRPAVPAALDQIVRRCVLKAPDERWQNAHDVKLALELIGVAGSTHVEGSRTRKWPWIALALATLAGGFFAGRVLRPAGAADAVRFEIAPPVGTLFTASENSTTALEFAVSPNGRLIVFVANVPGVPPKLWLRSIDSIDARPIEGTTGASFPFWSPDSRAVGFFADKKLKTIALGGGAPEVLADAPDTRGGSWSSDGVILFGPSIAGPLYRVAATGGETVPATRLDPAAQERAHRWPYFLPNSHHFLFLNLSGAMDRRGLYVGSLDSSERKLLFKSNSSAVYSSGHLFFLRAGTLWAQPFDPSSLRLSGSPVVVAQEVGYTPGVRYGAFAASGSGVIAYAARGGGLRQLQWFDRKGQLLQTITTTGDWRASALSPNGQKAIASNSDPGSGALSIFILDAMRGGSSRFSYSAANESVGVFSPDGTQIVFGSDRAGLPDLYVKSVSGRGDETQFVRAQGAAFVTDWSAHYVVYHDRSQNTGNDVWVVPMNPRGAPLPFLRTSFSESQGVISPDEHWMAYTSDESGRPEIYVQPFPSGGEKTQVSRNGGAGAAWRRDGKELFYMSAVGELVAVPVHGGEHFDAEAPHVLFHIPGALLTSILYANYVPTSDGQRFLVTVSPQPPHPPTITTTIHWKPGA